LPAFKKILFFLPGNYNYEDRCQAYLGKSCFTYREPVEEMYMSAVASKFGIKTHVLYRYADKLSKAKTLQLIKQFHPDLIIISTTFPSMKEDMEWIYKLKKLRADTLIGIRGGQTCFIDLNLLFKKYPGLDFIIKGESEFVLEEILQKGLENAGGVSYLHNGELRDNNELPYNQYIDKLPFIDRSGLSVGSYRNNLTFRPMSTIVVSRGCPAKCKFCLAPSTMGNSYRLREVDKIIEELSKRIKTGIDSFFFRAETFTYNKSWVIDLCRKIVEKKWKISWVSNSRTDTIDEEMIRHMAAAGCVGLSIGIETNTNQTIQWMNKGVNHSNPNYIQQLIKMIHSYEIFTLGYYIIGFPWETRNDILKTTELAKKINASFSEFFFPYPFPGTDLYKIASKMNLLNHKNIPYSQQKPIFLPKDISELELLKLRQQARRINFKFTTLKNLIKLNILSRL